MSRFQNATQLLPSGVNTDNDNISPYDDLNCLLKRSRCSKLDNPNTCEIFRNAAEIQTSQIKECKPEGSAKGTAYLPSVWLRLEQVFHVWVSKDCLRSRC